MIQISPSPPRPIEDRGYVIFSLGLLLASAKAILKPGWSRGELARQLVAIGVQATGMVCLVCLCIGLILSMQTAPQLTNLSMESLIPFLVMAALTKEMAPLLTAIIVIGRSGSAVAAQLGAMKVSDEVEALRVMAIDPMDFLVAPRVIAMAIMMPVLSILGIYVGMFGSWLFCHLTLSMDSGFFVEQALRGCKPTDLWLALIKSLTFGIIVITISCRLGLSASGGAEGVGRSTTTAVALSILAILVADVGFNAFLSAAGLQ